MIFRKLYFKQIIKLLTVISVSIFTFYIYYTHLHGGRTHPRRGTTDLLFLPLALLEYKNVTPCPPTPPNLANDAKPRMDLIDWRTQEKRHVEIHLGGWWAPRHCISSNHVAILVPYRARDEHLHIFINNIHDYLQKQELLYGIYIVEQAGNFSFNRGKLLNIAFNEAMKDHNWGCVVLHDVDHLPMNENNLYICNDKHPSQLSVTDSKHNFVRMYSGYVGGVTMLTSDMYKKINGMSNMYWGWGGEDDDLYKRCRMKKFLPFLQRTPAVGKYQTIDKNHERAAKFEQRLTILRDTAKLQDNDGLNNLNYTIQEKEYRHLFTYILADIGQPPPLSVYKNMMQAQSKNKKTKTKTKNQTKPRKQTVTEDKKQVKKTKTKRSNPNQKQKT